MKTKRVRLSQLVTDWGISKSTAERWRASKLPIWDYEKLGKALLRRKNTPQAIRNRALGILSGFFSKTTPEAIVVEEKLAKATVGMVEDLEREAHHYQVKQLQARSAGDVEQEKTALETRVKLYQALISIRKQLRQLGEDNEKTIPRDQVEQIIAALAARTSKAIGRMGDILGERIIGLTRVEQVAAVMEPQLVRDLFLDPFEEATRYSARVGLPEWVVDKLRRGMTEYVTVENVEADHDAAVG